MANSLTNSGLQVGSYSHSIKQILDISTSPTRNGLLILNDKANMSLGSGEAVRLPSSGNYSEQLPSINVGSGNSIAYRPNSGSYTLTVKLPSSGTYIYKVERPNFNGTSGTNATTLNLSDPSNLTGSGGAIAFSGSLSMSSSVRIPYYRIS